MKLGETDEGREGWWEGVIVGGVTAGWTDSGRE